MINETSLATGVGVSAKNVQFRPEALNLSRRIAIVGTYDPGKANVAPLVPQLILSPEDAASRYGFGSMLHRLALQAFLGSQGVETYVIPQEEVAESSAAVGHVDFTGSANVQAGSLYVYIANNLVRVTVAADMSAGQIATALVTALNKLAALPVTAAVDGNTVGMVNITSKAKGTWGNDITLAFNLGFNERPLSGIVAAITPMAGGAGVPNITDALNALGTGDDANELGITDFIHGYGQDAATLDAISDYVGAGNEAVGLYSKTVARPFRALVGDTAAGSQGLTDLIALAEGRKLDRANGVVVAPGSYSHPQEIAAQAMGYMARINQTRVAQGYVGAALVGIQPGDVANRWTSDYDNRDTAVKHGISPTRVESGAVRLQNVVTFYRPDDVPVNSNGYRSMRNISIIQNMLHAVQLNFSQEKWRGISIVADIMRVSSTVDREKARDIDAVINDLVALAKSFETKAWIFTADYTINALRQVGTVQIRPGGLGFNSRLPVIFSGEGGILDTTVEFDTSFAALLN